MRQLVNTKTFRLKKKLDNILHAILPNNWIPLYSMVGIYSVVAQNLLSLICLHTFLKGTINNLKYACTLILYYHFIVIKCWKKALYCTKLSVNWSWQGRVKSANTMDVCWSTKLSHRWPLNRQSWNFHCFFKDVCSSD